MIPADDSSFPGSGTDAMAALETMKMLVIALSEERKELDQLFGFTRGYISSRDLHIIPDGLFWAFASEEDKESRRKLESGDREAVREMMKRNRLRILHGKLQMLEGFIKNTQDEIAKIEAGYFEE